MSEPIIHIENLSKLYDDVPAVHQLSLRINKGEVFGLLGPNGAGKSTTIFMLLGLTEPTSGSVQVSGINPTTHPIDVKKRVGYLPDDLGFYQNMTGLENLMYTARLNGIPESKAKEQAKTLLRQVGLEDAMDKKTGKYSRGMKQRLGLADVLIKDPEVIILDEPTLGIDPKGVRELLQLIKQLNEEKNITILLSSHHLHQVQQICDRVGIFVKGQLLAEGTIQELAQKLFDNDSYVVHVEAEPLDDRIISDIRSIEDVSNVQRINERTIYIYCKRDITPIIANKLMEYPIDLSNISKKNFGLDEIYHRYFEGREDDETA